MASCVDNLVEKHSLSKAEWLPVVQDLVSSASKAPAGALPGSAAALEAWIDELRDREFACFAEACSCQDACPHSGYPLQAPKSQAACSRAALDDAWQERLATMWPVGAELVFMAQTGSFMYNLQVASSDCDYAVIFMARPEDLCKREPP